MTTPSRIFRGPNGLRAGWALALFVAMLLPLAFLAARAVDHVIGPAEDRSTLFNGFLLMCSFLVPVLLATAVMARIERRSFSIYGLPWRRAFCLNFWQGAAFGFASLAVLLLVLQLFGVYSFGPVSLHGAAIFKFGLLWTVPLFVGALAEDMLYRGYLLYTLTRGIGFWPAATITSLLMGGLHYFNPGGHGLGPVAATLYCLVTVLVLRRTGDLWMPLGIHTGWGYGVVFFFGLPSSGFSNQDHLLNGSFRGPTWLTGGEFGVEAGLPSLIMLALWGIFFASVLHGVRYPTDRPRDGQLTKTAP